MRAAERTARVKFLPIVLEKKKVYRRPITGFATVKKMQSRGLKRLIRRAAISTPRRIMGAESAITPGKKVFNAQLAARFRKIPRATAMIRKKSHPRKERPFGRAKFSKWIIKQRTINDSSWAARREKVEQAEKERIKMSFRKMAKGRGERY